MYCRSLLILLLLPCLALAQGTIPVKDFSATDSLARTVRYHGDLHQLTTELTAPYADQLSKTRALFIWVTHNIAYDYKDYNRKKGVYVNAFRRKPEGDYLLKILRKKKAICDGYARLFRSMCTIAGIRCEVITGYTKNKPYQAGSLGAADHAWNAVYLDSAWFAMDPTWAAGGCAEDDETGKLISFRRKFNNYYWQASDREFHRNHYPEDNRWVFENNYTREKFKTAPYISGDVIEDLQLVAPAPDVIKARKGDTLHFRFRCRQPLSFLQVNTNISRNLSVYKLQKISRRQREWVMDTFALRRQQYIPFRKEYSHYEFDYVVTDEYVSYLEVLFDYRRAFRYKVLVDRSPRMSAGQ
ncbi:transglutaminase domain-containing protein [Chitinophaga varians]|uniref:transglutaminase domain-containing protein n=1 Tax=Chitinophaga varians TaxID=2202339 RepID=UPI00165EDAAE|nr:transglutaminase domain-containing protein [Chitinophaga varians]MBC9909983.1 hypothetical protein [Chitinophaga varians]